MVHYTVDSSSMLSLFTHYIFLLETDEIEAKKPRIPVCCLCCGVNNDLYLTSVVEKVKLGLEQTPYAVSSFALGLMLPPAILVRQHALSLYLEVHPSQTGLKDMLRPQLARAVSTSLNLSYDCNSAFRICLEFDHPELRGECAFLATLHPNAFKTSKERDRRVPVITSGSVQKVLDKMQCKDYQDNNYWPPPPLLTAMNNVKVLFTHESIYLGGRYNKYSRALSQTPWLIEGQRKTATSVQELIGDPLLRLYGSKEVKFSSSGREDADVRMLGRGRPFAIEIVNPHNPNVTPEELSSVADNINSDRRRFVRVNNLQVVSKETCERLKEGEEEKRKCYCALVKCLEEVLPIDVCSLERHKNLVIHQKTPIRVLHRRSLATRERTIFSLRTEFVNSRHFKLHLCTQAGTYVKEFIHGDFGRTTPNICSLLGQEADIVALDVEEVVLDWPPS